MDKLMTRSLLVAASLAGSILVAQPALANDTGVTNISRVGGDLLSYEMSNAESFTVTITNFDTDNQTNVPVTLDIDGPGGLQTANEVVASVPNSTTTEYTFTTTFDLSLTGDYTLTASTSLGTDADNSNDTLVAIATSAEGISLPVHESFEQVTEPTALTGISGEHQISGLTGWTWQPSSTSEQLQFDQTFKTPRSGSKTAALDLGSDGQNALVLTFDGSGLSTVDDDVRLSFFYVDMSDEDSAFDWVFVRGSPDDPWLTAFDWNDGLNDGNWEATTATDISTVLDGGGQSYSARTQVRFQQSDNEAIPNDGLILDNVSIEVIDSTSSASWFPESLIARMVDSVDEYTDGSDIVDYEVTLANPLGGSSNPEFVIFEITSWPSRVQPVTGTDKVITTDGTVIAGNNSSDDVIRVGIDELTEGQVVKILFSAQVDLGATDSITLQGVTKSSSFDPFLTDDPRVAGNSNPVVTLLGDLDPVASSEEDLVPDMTGAGTGDADGNGIADRAENDVISFALPSDGSYFTLRYTGDQELETLTFLPAPSGLPSNVTALGDAFFAQMDLLSVGETRSFELYVPAGTTINAIYAQEDVSGNWTAPGSGNTAADNKTVISFSLTDGGLYDLDGSADGKLSFNLAAVNEAAAPSPPSSSGGSGGGGGAFSLLTVLAILARKTRAITSRP